MSRARRWITNDVVFAGVALVLVALTYTPLAGPLNEPLCAVSYRGATWLLNALHIPHVADAAHRVIAHRPFAIEVTGLCSGLRALALWGAVALLLPVPRWQKALHFALGSAVLVLLNVVRIAHLFHVGVHRPPSFSLYHEWLWPGALVGAILLYRLVRLVRPSRPLEAAHG